VARRRTAKRANSKGSQAVVIFWLIFVIVIIAIFMLNAPVIQKNFDLFKTRLIAGPGSEGDTLDIEEDPLLTVNIEQPPSRDPLPTPPPLETTTQPAEQPAAPTQTTTPPAPPPSAPPVTTPAPSQPPAVQPVQMRERAVYFTQVGSDGQILHSRVTRRIPVSESPMQDSINALLAGPSSDEIGRGILNLIPRNTRLLSATVRGNTAYLSFSEDFLFNTFGVEGYVAQLRQIVWTVTEFQNVRDVQFLIEGRRLDYLGEGIWIGSPISRQSF